MELLQFVAAGQAGGLQFLLVELQQVEFVQALLVGLPSGVFSLRLAVVAAV
jgi:hypothetical protein